VLAKVTAMFLGVREATGRGTWDPAEITGHIPSETQFMRWDVS